MKDILIFHHKLYDNELIFVNKLISSLNLPNSKIADLSKEEINIDYESIDRIICIYDETKTVNPFQKVYASLNINKDIPILRIDRPNTIAKNKELQSTLWKTLINFCPIEFNQKILDKLTNNDFKLVIQYIKDNSLKYLNVIAEGRQLEIRPDNSEIKNNPSITYSDFFILMLIKYTFKTDKVAIS